MEPKWGLCNGTECGSEYVHIVPTSDLLFQVCSIMFCVGDVYPRRYTHAKLGITITGEWAEDVQHGFGAPRLSMGTG